MRSNQLKCHLFLEPHKHTALGAPCMPVHLQGHAGMKWNLQWALDHFSRQGWSPRSRKWGNGIVCVCGWGKLQNILEQTMMGFLDENEDMDFSLAICPPPFHLCSQTFLEVSLDHLVTYVQPWLGLMAGAEWSCPYYAEHKSHGQCLNPHGCALVQASLEPRMAQRGDSHIASRSENWHNIFREKFGSICQNYQNYPFT